MMLPIHKQEILDKNYQEELAELTRMPISDEQRLQEF